MRINILLKQNNNSKDWIFLNEVTGQEKVYLPEDFNELLVFSLLGGNNASRGSAFILKTELSGDEERNFQFGAYGSSQAYFRVVISATTSYAFLNNYIYNGSTVTTNSKIRVYYR